MPSFARFPTAIVFILALSATAIAVASAADSFRLSSPSIQPGASIAEEFACTGRDSSPALAWTGAPASTRTYALIVEDPDAPRGTFIHWVAYNIPASTNALAAGIAANAELPGGGIQGVNGSGNIGYNGPCPPPGKVHHYHFRLFALDATLDLAAGADANALQSAMKDHVVATTELVGTFSR